jgi:lipopolysaccharide export system protein LptA
MRWQRIARLAIAMFVLVFAAIVAVQLRRPPKPVERAQTPRTDDKSTVELGELTHSRYDAQDKLLFTIDAKRGITYPDGRQVLTDADLTLPDRDGRTLKVHGGSIELVYPQDKSSKAPIQTATITKGAKLTASDGLVVTSEQAVYDERTGIVTIPGDVQFTRGRMSGAGVGATYDKGRNVMWLLDQARLSVKPDATGGGAAEASAKAIGLARTEHYVRLTEMAHIVGEGRTLDANEIVLWLSEDETALRRAELRGNSRISGGAAGAAAEGMSARDIDLTYAPDGRTLQQARLVENASVQINSPGGARTVSASTIDLTMGADGSTVTGLSANQNVVVELPPSADAPARRITSATLSGGGAAGLQNATFAGGVVFHEVKAGGRGAAATGERTARSQRLIVQTQPGFGTLQQADFRGTVHIVDGETVADGQRIVHQVAQDSFDVMMSPGDPGPSPSVNDGRILVNARTINFTIGTRKLKADGDVRSSVQPSRHQTAKPSPAAARGRGGATAPDSGKMPSMLKQDQPVNVTSAKLDYDGAAGSATYTGNARLWQDQTQIQADEIVVDDRSGNLTGRGHVRTVMFFDEVDEKTKAKRPVQTIATADNLLYEDAKRLATYTTGPTAKAHMVGTQGDVTADRIQLFMKQNGGELERAEADGTVTVTEGIRTATGQHLTYTTADETYVMTGSPVEIEERKATECRISSGNTLRFRKAGEAMTLDNNQYVPVKFRQCAAK